MAKGEIQSINPAAEQMFDCASAEVAGKCITELMPEPYRMRHRLRLAASLNATPARFQQVEVEGLRRDGSTFPAELSVAPWEADGKLYFTGIIRDVTQRKRREEKINVLLREVNHRSKNMLSLVQAIASSRPPPGTRSSSSATSPSAYARWPRAKICWSRASGKASASRSW